MRREFRASPLLFHPSCNVLRDIQTDRGNLHVDDSPHVIRLRRTTLWHFDAGSWRRPTTSKPEPEITALQHLCPHRFNQQT